MQLDKWRRDWALMSTFFSAGEIAAIAGRLRNIEIQNVVFCSFENRFAKSGGLASVITNILPYLKEVNGIPSVILMTPFYPRIMSTGRLKSTGKSFGVPFFDKIVKAELLEYTWHYNKPRNGTLKEYYLKAEGFFGAANKLNDPYIYSESDPAANKHSMDENAVFFCRAVPYALKALGIRENITCTCTSGRQP
ncbi:MAG: glycogen synthase [Deferribacteres bacterium]|nr:glycogen synthase [Deferribacteres bacterium]